MNLEDKIKDLLEDSQTETKDIQIEEEKQEVVEEKQQKDVAEHMSALFEGQELSEEFKQKTQLIFEAAVQEVAEARVAELEEQFQEQINEAVDSLTEELVEQIDGFLDLVVEQWMEDNAVAVESGLRSEIVGNFINGLKDLFQEHYIEVPDTQVDILGEQADQIDSLKDQINRLVESNLALQHDNEVLGREMVIENICYDLTQVEKEKVKSLAENVDASSPEEFAEKVKSLKESYVKKPTNVTENVAPQLDNTPATQSQLNEAMSAYTRAIASGAQY